MRVWPVRRSRHFRQDSVPNNSCLISLTRICLENNITAEELLCTTVVREVCWLFGNLKKNENMGQLRQCRTHCTTSNQTHKRVWIVNQRLLQSLYIPWGRYTKKIEILQSFLRVDFLLWTFKLILRKKLKVQGVKTWRGATLSKLTHISKNAANLADYSSSKVYHF